MKILVLGLGGSGSLHLKAYQRLRHNFNIDIFVSDIDKTKETYYANQGFNIGNSQGKYDLVDICAPTHFHHKLVLEWISRANVLVEKPMCLTAFEAGEMIEASEESNNFLAVCHNQLFYPLLTSAKLDEKIDYIVVNRASNEEFPSWVYAEGGGHLFESGYHGFYMFYYLFGLHGIAPQFKMVHRNGEDYHFIFDVGIVRSVKASHDKDSICLYFSNGKKKRLNCWFHSPWIFGSLSKKLSSLDLRFYMLLHRRYPYSDTHFNLLKSVLYSLQNRLNLDARVSPDLSMKVVKVLEHAKNVL